MTWFKRRRKVHVYSMGDGRWSARVAINNAAVWKTRDTAVEAVEALRLYLIERELSTGRDIEVDW